MWIRQTILSPSLRASVERLHTQRNAFFPVLDGVTAAMVWRRPRDTDWAAGDTLLHLCRAMRVYRLLIQISWPVLFPVAWLLRTRPFERDIVDIFSQYEAAGVRMRATPLLVPRRPNRLPALHELREQLEAETKKMENTLGGIAEGVAGHFRLFDPGVGSPNLVQRVQLLAFHERHHFKIIERLLTEGSAKFS